MQTEKEKVHFTGAAVTQLGALWFRAQESRRDKSLLRDPMAEEAVRRIDYDFDAIKPVAGGALQVVMRARQFDVWTRGFLAQHPDATVLYLGCGLDSCIYRIDPPPSVRWYDLDFPEVIELRRKLYPERASYHLIGSSVTEQGWLDQVPGDRTAWIIMAGLTYFLPYDAVPPLLNSLTDHFPHGEMIFDAVSQFGAKMARGAFKGTDVPIGWYIDNARVDMRRIDPKLELVTELKPSGQDGIDQLGLSYKLLGAIFNWFPPLRRINRMLRYRF